MGQIQIDVTGKPIVLTRVIEDASALGAAILTSYGVGFHKTIDEAIAAMIKVTEKITSIPENCEVYNRLSSRICFFKRQWKYKYS